jgi:hypothetical protein
MGVAFRCFVRAYALGVWRGPGGAALWPRGGPRPAGLPLDFRRPRGPPRPRAPTGRQCATALPPRASGQPRARPRRSPLSPPAAAAAPTRRGRRGARAPRPRPRRTDRPAAAPARAGRAPERPPAPAGRGPAAMPPPAAAHPAPAPGPDAAALARRFGLAGRAALVTGGSRGIGRAVAEALAAAGARVFICALRGPELEAALAGMRGAGLDVQVRRGGWGGRGRGARMHSRGAPRAPPVRGGPCAATICRIGGRRVAPGPPHAPRPAPGPRAAGRGRRPVGPGAGG